MYDNLEKKIAERKDIIVKTDAVIQSLFAFKNITKKELELFEYASKYKPIIDVAVTTKPTVKTVAKKTRGKSKKKPVKKPKGKKLSKNGKPLGRPRKVYAGQTLESVMNPASEE